MIKMLETLPVHMQEHVVEHVREYIDEMREELKWNEAFANSQEKLAAAAKHAREEIKAGLARPLDISGIRRSVFLKIGWRQPDRAMKNRK
jgi:galactose-1-phosphate uridylyltransferase